MPIGILLSASSSTADTVGVTVGARYLLGPVLASLTANWLYVSNSTDSNTRVRVLKKDGHAGVLLCVYEPLLL